jgi:hypothetical protein
MTAMREAIARAMCAYENDEWAKTSHLYVVRATAALTAIRAAGMVIVPSEKKRLDDVQVPTREQQREQGERCGCRGSDDYCPCQNVVQKR